MAGQKMNLKLLKSSNMDYFISDTHFGHKNLCEKYRGLTVEESDELLIKNWNNRVRKEDKVYYLGDFSMDAPNLLEKYLSRLNGQIYVIGGNHDTRRVCEKFRELGVTVLGCMRYKEYILSHFPISKRIIKERPYKGNIHGHIHAYELVSPDYVSVAADLNDMTPLTFEEIIEKQRNKHRWKIKLKNFFMYLKFLFNKYFKQN